MSDSIPIQGQRRQIGSTEPSGALTAPAPGFFDSVVSLFNPKPKSPLTHGGRRTRVKARGRARKTRGKTRK